MKKILISLSIIGAVAALAVTGTRALFSDTETSAGNVFTAGSIDLKVDHLAQTYDGLDCNTASVEVVSDTTNKVTGTVGGNDPVSFPHNALLVTSINPAWTASILGANWIWSQDPTPLTEYNIDTIYTFEKTFNWMGPVTGATLALSIGTDNSYEIYLNGHLVAGDNTEQNYNAAGQDTYTGTVISNQIVQGENTLRFVVKNWARPQGETWDNPGGLLYKLVIDGNPTSNDFKAHCQLWNEKDLVQGDHFWTIGDVKPGDYGTNLISLHVLSNDAYTCLYTGGTTDLENGINNAEAKAGDVTLAVGELSNYLNAIVWADNGNGVHDSGEAVLYNGPLKGEYIPKQALASNGIGYLGLAWCAGTQTVDAGTGVISCSGAGNQNDAQTDSFTADLTAYAVQQRNNTSFDCSSIR